MTEVILRWDHHLRSFELAKLEKAWQVWQEVPANIARKKRCAWVIAELEKFPELFDEELFECSRYAVLIERKLWEPR